VFSKALKSNASLPARPVYGRWAPVAESWDLARHSRRTIRNWSILEGALTLRADPVPAQELFFRQWCSSNRTQLTRTTSSMRCVMFESLAVVTALVARSVTAKRPAS